MVGKLHCRKERKWTDEMIDKKQMFYLRFFGRECGSHLVYSHPCCFLKGHNVSLSLFVIILNK